MVGLGCFLPEPTKKISHQNEEKTEGRKLDYLMDKNAHVHLHMGTWAIRPILFFSFSLFLCWILPFFLSFDFLGCGCDSCCCCCFFFFSFFFFFFDLLDMIFFF